MIHNQPELICLADPSHFDQLAESFYIRRAENIESVKICRRNNDPEHWIRFIHAELEDNTRKENISSTYIRREIIDSPVWQLSDTIGPLVLNFDILRSFIEQRVTEQLL